MNRLYIPPAARVWVYGIFGAVGVALGATQVGFAAAEAGQPVWLTVALAVYAFLGPAIGYTAATNTSRTDPVTVNVNSPAAEVPGQVARRARPDSKS